MLRQAQQDLASGKTDEARKSANRALELDPDNIEAKALLGDLSSGRSGRKVAQAVVPAKPEPKPVDAAAPVAVQAEVAVESKRVTTPARAKGDSSVPAVKNPTRSGGRAAAPAPAPVQMPGAAVVADEGEAAFQKGLVAYEAGRLDVAVQWWNHALSVTPNHPRAIQYLQQTRGEYDAWVQQHQYNAVQLQREAAASGKLDTAITYDTAGQKSIVEFLNALSLIADVSFYLSAGVDPDVRITAKFEETPLHDTLDIVLLPLGLKWSRQGDVISVTPDLQTKFFNLSPAQSMRLKALLENKTLQTYLYGPEATPPMKNVELALDDRNNTLLVTDAQENIYKVEAFLKDLESASPPGLIYKSWKIRPEEGQKIKAIVEGLLKVESDAPYDLQRKVLVDGNDLIVNDTAENIAKVEMLLLDKNFIRKLETQKLAVATFNLTPTEPISENLEQVRDYATNVVTVVKTILYAQSTESQASAEGRRYWYDPNTLQLTIVDFPENLREVSSYIRSLPTISRKQKSEIIFLNHQTATDMQDLINRVLGLTETEQAGTGTGNSVTKTLRAPNGSMTFRDLRLRVVKVNENDAGDRNDDSVELVIETATQASEERTITEFRSEYVDNYQIRVEDVRPSGTTGEGSARIEVSYNPLGTGGTAGVGGVGVGTIPQPGVAGVPGQLGILPDGTVAGQTAAAATEAAVQVEIIENLNALLIRYDDPGDLAEIKSYIDALDIPVLQVNIETKLVEVLESRAKEWLPEFDLANLTKGPTLGNELVDGRFGRYVDEYRDPFDPFPEDLGNASLLKGTTVLNFTSLGESPVNFTLRTLESEGVINVVNGPHILVENGETADFEIERRFGGLLSISGGTNNQTQGTQQVLPQVRLSVTPNITQTGQIRLEIQDLELQDFGNDGGSVVTVDIDDNDASDPYEPTAIARALNYELRRRTLSTVARCSDGGTIVLGGWTGERSRNSESGVPILRKIPYVGKLLFNRTSDRTEKSSLLIFLTCNIIKP